MKLLGAILAGGRSTRFGADKAAATIDGKALIDHVMDAMRPQVDTLVVCGRDWPGLTALPDRPAPDLGPLGGLCAALEYAVRTGHDAVLTVGCDVLPVPPDLHTLLGVGPAFIEGQPLFALWPAALADRLTRHLALSDDRSIRRWAKSVAARGVPLARALFNLNTPADLARYNNSISDRTGPAE